MSFNWLMELPLRPSLPNQFINITSCSTGIILPSAGDSWSYTDTVGLRGLPLIIIIMKHSIQPKPPAFAIIRQNGLSSTSCRASVAVTPVCVMADLVNPGGGWPTTGTSPFLRWALAVSRLGRDSKDPIGWYGVWESGNVAEYTESLFVNNKWDFK